MTHADGGAPPPTRGRTPLQALLYWSVVLSIWGLIFVVGLSPSLAIQGCVTATIPIGS